MYVIQDREASFRGRQSSICAWLYVRKAIVGTTPDWLSNCNERNIQGTSNQASSTHIPVVEDLTSTLRLFGFFLLVDNDLMGQAHRDILLRLSLSQTLTKEVRSCTTTKEKERVSVYAESQVPSTWNTCKLEPLGLAMMRTGTGRGVLEGAKKGNLVPSISWVSGVLTLAMHAFCSVAPSYTE